MWPSLGPDGSYLGRQGSPRPNQLRDPRTRQSWAKWHKLQVGKNLTSHPFDTPSWLLPKPPLPLFVYLL